MKHSYTIVFPEEVCQANGTCKVLLDGKELPGVVSVAFTADLDEMNTATIKVIGVKTPGMGTT